MSRAKRYRIEKSTDPERPWDIIDTETGKSVDDASTHYEARMAATAWNEGVYTKRSTY